MQADKKAKKVAKKGFPSTMPATGPSPSSSGSLSSSQSIPSSFQHASSDKKHQTAPLSARNLRSESVSHVSSSGLPSLNMANLASSSSSSSVNTLGSSRKDTHRENTKKTPVSSPREVFRPIFAPLICDRRSASSSSATPSVQPEISVAEQYAQTFFSLFRSMGLNDQDALEQVEMIDYNLSKFPQRQKLQNATLYSPSFAIWRDEINPSVSSFTKNQEYLQSVVNAQKYVRAWLVRKRHSRPAKEIERIQKRNQWFVQMAKEEKEFIQYLEHTITNFLQPLRRNQVKTIAVPTVVDIFANIEDLVQKHLQLYDRFRKAIVDDPKWPFISGIGECFFSTAEDLFRAYSIYVENHQVSMDAVAKNLQENGKFASFVKEAEAKSPLSHMPFTSLLSLPMNRIIKYEKGLYSILCYSVPEDPGYNDLYNAASMMGKMAQFIDNSIETSSNRAIILAVARRVESEVPLGLVTNARRVFIREGTVKRIGDKKNGYLMLFSDLLLTGEHLSASSSQHLTMKHWKTIDLSLIEIVNSEKSTKNEIIIKISNPEEQITLRFKSSSEKTSWLADLSTVVEVYEQKKVFGVPLSKVLDLEQRQQPIPSIVSQCMRVLEAKGLNAEGIFRVPGDAGVISRLKRLYDSGKSAEINWDKTDAHDVAGLMKLYIRELPTPLFPFETFDRLMHLQRGFDQAFDDSEFPAYLHQLSSIVRDLSPDHFMLFRALFEFLCRVAVFSEENKMCSRNLAVVFAPNIIRPLVDTVETALLSPQITVTVKNFIDNYDQIIENINSMNNQSVRTKAPSTPPHQNREPSPPPPSYQPPASPVTRRPSKTVSSPSSSSVFSPPVPPREKKASVKPPKEKKEKKAKKSKKSDHSHSSASEDENQTVSVPSHFIAAPPDEPPPPPPSE